MRAGAYAPESTQVALCLAPLVEYKERTHELYEILRCAPASHQRRTHPHPIPRLIRGAPRAVKKPFSERSQRSSVREAPCSSGVARAGIAKTCSHCRNELHTAKHHRPS